MTNGEFSNSDPDGPSDEIKARAERLRQAVRRAGGNTQVAARAGMPFGTLNRYIAGRDMKASAMVALAKACNVPLEWLAEGDGASYSAPLSSAPASHPNENDATIEFTNFDIFLSAGFGSENNDVMKSHRISLPRRILPKEALDNQSNIISLHVRGDSMQPTIDDGDLILIKTDVDALTSGAIYAIRIDNSLLVKRLKLKANGNVSVVSDNPTYPPEELDAVQLRQMIQDGGSPTRIIGRVVWRSGPMGLR